MPPPLWIELSLDRLNWNTVFPQSSGCSKSGQKTLSATGQTGCLCTLVSALWSCLSSHSWNPFSFLLTLTRRRRLPHTKACQTVQLGPAQQNLTNPSVFLHTSSLSSSSLFLFSSCLLALSPSSSSKTDFSYLLLHPQTLKLFLLFVF